MKRIILSFLTILLWSGGGLYAQSVTVTGTVTSHDDSAPIPGVNITLKGGAQGTVTDLDGKYSIDVPGSESVLCKHQDSQTKFQLFDPV